ncbi:HIG1 domain family member 2A, mitochondrial [Lepeophtheirus salmonis]|uniref:HIG1 domain family member 2A n=1 Tax=Lepeophtheirus salmonis TaxID=72036 RepID=D3PGB0_LEPSM|nr:HIG1 domain family member 2A, mitochondrial-like [Lepeophtheirus salmonis]ADD24306.1 HIG1 domain family member 2A [Lepeophtheirus salmonis]
MSDNTAKPKLEWIQDDKNKAVNDNVNPLYYRDDMDFLRENIVPQTASASSLEFFKNNLLVSVGCLATSGFLISGLKSFYNKNTVRSQKMMRRRVIAQGLTIVALFVGALQEGNKRLQNDPIPSSPPSSN